MARILRNGLLPGPVRTGGGVANRDDHFHAIFTSERADRDCQADDGPAGPDGLVSWRGGTPPTMCRDAPQEGPITVSPTRGVSTMLGSIRAGVTAAVAVLVALAGLSCVLAGVSARPAGMPAGIEFTADGKLKKPVGYRKWVYVGTPVTPNDLNDGEAPFPEFHAVYIDPESFAHYEKTGEFRDGTVMIKGAHRRPRPRRRPAGRATSWGNFPASETSIKDTKRFQGRARLVGLLQLRPLVPAQGGGGEEPLPPHATIATSPAAREGLRVQPVLPCLACSSPSGSK